MSEKLPGLDVRLAAEIAESGPLRFDRFMAGALYDPAAGFYAAGRGSIGKDGDFYTSVSIGPVFGEILAGQFVEMWQALGQPANFSLIEQGAGDGQLARDVLDALASTPLAGAPLVIVEPLASLRAKQEAKLPGGAVSWVASPEDLPELCGVHYSNELFDALPVRLLRSTGGGWMESYVDVAPAPPGSGGPPAFVWLEREVDADLAGIAASLPVRPKGFAVEICRAQRPLLGVLADKIARGFLLAIDYGMDQESLLAPHRSDGTLSCYRHHRRDANPLEAPGEKDITAHVNFSRLSGDAVDAGWRPAGFTDQHHFLVGAATALLRSLDGVMPDAAGQKKLRALRTLLHPESMGRQFHAILFSRGLDDAKLTGFQYARKAALL